MVKAERTLDEIILDIYPQLPNEQQSGLRNVFSILKDLGNIYQNPDEDTVETKLNLGTNALQQINNLLNASVPTNIKQDFDYVLQSFSNIINKSNEYYSQFVSQPTYIEPEEITVEEETPEWIEPKEEKPQKLRRLTSLFLSPEIKSERDKEIEAQDLGLTKKEYDELSKPIEDAVKVGVSIDYPDPKEIDVEDFETAHFVLKDRQKDVPENLKDSYGILTDAVGIIANAVDDQRAELAFREFETIFAEVVNGLAKEAPALFEDLNEWLGVVYVAAYKIAADFDLTVQTDIDDDLTVQQSGGSAASYDFRKNVKEYWKKYRQGGVFKRVYNPETKSFSVEYVGNDPEKREKVLENTRKNYENYLNRLQDSGRQNYYKRKADLERKKYSIPEKKENKIKKIKEYDKDLKNKIVRKILMLNRKYLNKIKAISTHPVEFRQKELNKIEEKRKKDIDALEKEILTLPEEQQKEIRIKFKEIDDNLNQEKTKILKAFSNSFKLLSLAGLLGRTLGPG